MRFNLTIPFSPGLFLENYLSEDFVNASLTVLSGQVIVEMVDNATNITLNEGQEIDVSLIQMEPTGFISVLGGGGVIVNASLS